ncbi:hypothetical protein Moror_4633 [Moniliophthora roreri MCA 2997]|uniref:Uncharacterized protein n=1 Tax=Moniliophthora roreri (strain MCA 2997) TaxID=1381753 RepID=V2WZR2_MONRO|nr:hypothetical protein Moror_4633 [Moniliophthora roreri MCA 2997]
MATSQVSTLPDIPQLYDPNFLNVLLPPQPKVTKVEKMDEKVGVDTPPPTNPLMSALQETAHRTRTENDAPAYSSALSPTLDAFNKLNAWVDAKDLDSVLPNAWEEDPELTLRLIWQLRSIHDGKSEKEAFYRAFGWLYKNHPRTAISNLNMLVAPACVRKSNKKTGKRKETFMSHGYWKDLLNILALATTNELHVKEPTFLHAPRPQFTYPNRSPYRVKQDPAQHNAEKQHQAREARVLKGQQRYANLVEKLGNDKVYRALYIAVARLFSDQLVKDLRIMHEIQSLSPTEDKERIGDLQRELSLVAKWAPSPGQSHDRHTNIATAITLLLHHSRQSINMPFPSSVSASPSTADEFAVLRSYFQRWILSPLRSPSFLYVPEPLMASNKWTSINYSRVASVCMQRHTEQFFTHDPEGFEKYLVAVEQGKKQISGATLMPHELVQKAVGLGDTMQRRDSVASSKSGKMTASLKAKEIKTRLAETQVRVVEQQWNALISRLKESGNIDNAIAICDVSGSMGNLHYSSTGYRRGNKSTDPILPAVALSLILACLAKPPFDGGFITFSENPQFVKLAPHGEKSLYQTIMDMESSAWGMNTDFAGVFLKLLLPLAKEKGLKKEDMIKRLFVFSDMQFDAADTGEEGKWETTYDTVKKAYEEAEYDVPEIVYWDLAAGGTVEVQGDREGVAMMNGWSANLMKVFFGEEVEPEPEEEGWETVEKEKTGEKEKEEEERFNPINVMKRAVAKDSFKGLVVVD